MRAIIYIVLGAIIAALGIWWAVAAGYTIAAILAMLVIAVGGALIVVGIADGLDKFSPTSRKL